MGIKTPKAAVAGIALARGPLRAHSKLTRQQVDHVKMKRHSEALDIVDRNVTFPALD